MSANFYRLASLVCLSACTSIANAQHVPLYQFEGGPASPPMATAPPAGLNFPTHQFTQPVARTPAQFSQHPTGQHPFNPQSQVARAQPSQAPVAQAPSLNPHSFSNPQITPGTALPVLSANGQRDIRAGQFQPVLRRSATFQNTQLSASSTPQLNLSNICGPATGNPFLNVPLNANGVSIPQQPDQTTQTAPSYSGSPIPNANFGATDPGPQINSQPRSRNSHFSAFSAPNPSHPQQQFIEAPPLPQDNGNCATGNCGTGDNPYVLPPLGSGRDCGGMFFTYDLLYWTVTSPTNTVIGDVGSEGTIVRGGIAVDLVNSLDTGYMDHRFHSGHRFEFGNSDGSCGWLANVSFGQQSDNLETTGVSFIPSDGTFPNQFLAGWVDENNDGFDDDLDFDNFFGRDGEDTGTPDGLGGFILPLDGTPDTTAATDFDDLRYFPALFDTFSVRNTVTVTNFELMRLNRNGSFEWQYGFRYFDFKERFALDGTGGTLDELHSVTQFDNQIIGLQVGGRYVITRPVGTLSIEGRFTAGANLKDARLTGTLATNSVLGAPNGPVNLGPQSFNRRIADQEFVPMGELRVTYTFPISCNSAIRLGYTGLIADGIGRASEAMVYQLPALGLNGAGNDGTVMINSITAGFEFRR
jgi:hypothetical protein